MYIVNFKLYTFFSINFSASHLHIDIYRVRYLHCHIKRQDKSYSFAFSNNHLTSSSFEANITSVWRLPNGGVYNTHKWTKHPKWNTSYNFIQRKFLHSFHFFSSVYKNSQPNNHNDRVSFQYWWNFKLISQNTRNISIKGFCNCWNVFVSHRISSTRFRPPRRALEIFGNIEVTEVPIVGNEAIRQALQVYRLLDFERPRWLFRPIRPAFCRCKPNVVL